MESVQQTTKGLPGLAALRKQAGVTQSEFADQVGLHRVTVSDYERGHRDPHMSVLRRLAAALNCAPADLLTAPAPREEVAMHETVVADSS
jgi:putative transcriptional regulator